MSDRSDPPTSTRFNEHLTVEQLRLKQGVSGPPGLLGLYLENWTEAERDAYAAALAEARQEAARVATEPPGSLAIACGL